MSNKVWMVAAISVLGATVCSTHAIAQSTTKADAKVSAKGAPLGSSWDDIKKMPDFFTGIWESRAGMIDGKVNVGYTEQAKAYIANYKGRNDIPLANETCQPAGMPIVMRAQSPLKFMYEPGLISIYMEHASDTRFIRLNRKLPESPNPTYLGNSVAHWEGDTLVIESVGFADDIVFQYDVKEGFKSPFAGLAGPPSPGSGPPPDLVSLGIGPSSFLSSVIFGPHGPNLRMVERMRLTDPDTLEWKLTIYDDTVFTGPYEADLHRFKRVRGEEATPQEWTCTASVSYYDEETDTHDELDPEEALKLLDSKVIK